MKKELEKIFFDVEKVPSVELSKFDNMEYNSENAYAIVAKWPALNDKKEGVLRRKTLNYCSDVYQLILNKDILEPLIPVLESKFKKINIRVGNDKDAQFGVRVSPAPTGLQKMSEEIVPLVTFTNSYDGKVLAQATGGLLRYLVDAKGNVFEMYSTFIKGLSFTYKFKHNNEGIYSMIELSDKVDQHVNEFAKITDLVERMQSVPVKARGADALEKFLRKMADKTIFPLKELEETIERVQYESMVLDCDPNLWTVYNSMNYITENSEAALTKKNRMDVNAIILTNIVQYMDVQLKRKAITV